MRVSILYIIISITALAGCGSTSYEKNRIPDKIGGNASSLILNYENRVKKYTQSNIDSHFNIYIEIEKPYIISMPPLRDIDKIYSIASIEGITVFRISISNTGTIISSERILSSGLGLDEIAMDLLKEIKIEPSYLAGKPENSSADIKFIFRADETE